MIVVAFYPGASLCLLHSSCEQKREGLFIKGSRFASGECRENGFQPLMYLSIWLFTNHDHIPLALAWHKETIGREVTFYVMNNLLDGVVSFPCFGFVRVACCLIIGVFHGLMPPFSGKTITATSSQGATKQASLTKLSGRSPVETE